MVTYDARYTAAAVYEMEDWARADRPDESIQIHLL